MIQDRDNLAGPADADLIRSHLDGQAEAFAQLIHRYEKPLYAYLARYTGDKALAEDVFQDTFLQVHQSAGLFDATKPFRPWLYTVATNKARDALRKRNRHPAVSLDMEIDDNASLGNIMPDNFPAPDEIFVNLETRRVVQEVIREMPEKMRNVLILSYYQGLPQKEIADILDVPVGTVKSRLHAAVKHFAEKWTVHCKEDIG